jgi:hypothetical protein
VAPDRAARLETNRCALAYHQTFRIGSYQLRLEPSPVAPGSTGPEEKTISAAASEGEPAEIQAAMSGTQRLSEPLIESSPTGRFGVAVKTLEASVTPGTSTNVSLIVINQSRSSDGFRITLSGIPKTWLPAPPPLIELPPGARQEINLTIHPPRESDSHAGSYRLFIQITSQNVFTETIEVWATLTVVPYTTFTSMLYPRAPACVTQPRLSSVTPEMFLKYSW